MRLSDERVSSSSHGTQDSLPVAPYPWGMDIIRRIRTAARVSLIIITAVLGVSREALAQRPVPIVVAAPGVLQELVLRDGTRALGRVEKVENNRVTFRTDAGATLEVDLAQVVSVEVAQGRIIDGDYWREDSNPTRLFFGPTGRVLKKGESYFGLYEVFMPFVQYGVTDRFSIGGGTPLFLGTDEHPIWFTPKLELLSRPSTHVSIGAMHFLNVDHAAFGVAYAAVTQGSTDSAATFGVGWAYARSGNDAGGTAVYMLGAEHRMTLRLKFVTENYVIDGHVVVTGGFRILGERLSADIGLVSPMDADNFGAVPMFNFVWKFAK